jgi:uncharacterized protein
MPHDAVETVRLLHEAFAAHDAARFSELVSPDIEWTSAENFIYADHSPYRGLQDVVAFLFGRLRQDWDHFSIRHHEILGGGDIVIAHGRFRGIFKVNGAPIDAQIVEVFQLQDGKIAKCQVYTDTAQFRDAINRIRSVSV